MDWRVDFIFHFRRIDDYNSLESLMKRDDSASGGAWPRRASHFSICAMKVLILEQVACE